MGFWTYASMVTLTLIGIFCLLINTNAASEILLSFSILAVFMNALISLVCLVPLTIMILVYRLSHSGKVCSGDYSNFQIVGDYDPTQA